MWKVLGNASLDESARPQPQRRPNAPAASKSANSSKHPHRHSSVAKARESPESPLSDGAAQALICDGKYQITGTIRKGATGFLYSGVEVPKGRRAEIADRKESVAASAGVDEVVLKIEECAAPKRQMQNEWQVYRALEAQRIATKDTDDALPAPGFGGFPRSEFHTAEMPNLPPSLRSDIDGIGSINGNRGDGSGGLTTLGGGEAGAGRAVNVLAMERLGDNLMTLSQGCRGRFSLQTTLRLGAQMVSLLRMLHSTGYVHRDIKPENFCVGRGKHADRIFLIDYGLACRADDAVSTKSRAASGEHTKDDGTPHTKTVVPSPANTSSTATFSVGQSTESSPKPGSRTGSATGLVGSVRYLSISAHAGIRQTRRCDLESLGYVLVYLVKGKLPWQGLTARTREAHMEKIRKSKTEEIPETLCKGLPALAEYLAYVRNLPEGEPADYSRAERIFTDGLRRRGFPPDAPFDWMHAHHPTAPASATAAMASSCGNRGIPGGIRPAKLGSVGGVVGSSAAKRPRLVVRSSSSEGVNGTGPIANGRGKGARSFTGATASAVFDLYADVPPPDESASSVKRLRATSFGADSSSQTSSAASNPTQSVSGQRYKCLESTTKVETETRRVGGVSIVGRTAEEPNAEDGRVSTGHKTKTEVEFAATSQGSVCAAGTETTAGEVDVSAALAKLRPHFARGKKAGGSCGGSSSKKFPRACALLENLLTAKLATENEEIVFGVVSDAVELASSVSTAQYAIADGARARPSDSIGEKNQGRMGLIAKGAAGEAVRQLVAAACAKRSIFSASRRDEVDRWGEQILKEDGGTAARRQDSNEDPSR